MSALPKSIHPDVLELDCTVEDTPRWGALIIAFEKLTGTEQKWALKEIRRRLKDLCARQNLGDIRRQVLFERVWGWVHGSQRRSQARAVLCHLAWIRHPWGRVGVIRKNTARRSRRFLIPSLSRVEIWKNWLIVESVGPDACETILNGLIRGMEAELLDQIATRAQRRARIRGLPACIALAPVRGLARAWGATQAQWSSARAEGFERRAGAIHEKQDDRSKNASPAKFLPQSRPKGTRRL